MREQVVSWCVIRGHECNGGRLTAYCDPVFKAHLMLTRQPAACSLQPPPPPHTCSISSVDRR